MRCRCVSDFPAFSCGYVCLGAAAAAKKKRFVHAWTRMLDGVNVGRSRFWEKETTGPQNLGMVSNLRYWSEVCLGNAWG